jgi:predicted small metal-binding protein
MPNEKRYVMDCRQHPSSKGCSLTISGTEKEVLDEATHHATTAHGMPNTPNLRQELRQMMKEEQPQRSATPAK